VADPQAVFFPCIIFQFGNLESHQQTRAIHSTYNLSDTYSSTMHFSNIILSLTVAASAADIRMRFEADCKGGFAVCSNIGPSVHESLLLSPFPIPTFNALTPNSDLL